MSKNVSVPLRGKASRTPNVWRCPRCGRIFAKRNQAHSCHARSVDDHFRFKNPDLRVIYEVLVARLRRFGPLRVDAVRSSINLVSKHHFAAVAVRNRYLRLGFISKIPIRHPRILRCEKLGHTRYHHSLILQSLADVDNQLTLWLRKAYDLQT